jgi:hypothetical protein
MILKNCRIFPGKLPKLVKLVELALEKQNFPKPSQKHFVEDTVTKFVEICLFLLEGDKNRLSLKLVVTKGNTVRARSHRQLWQVR